MFPTITQNDINWAFEKYLWKKNSNLKARFNLNNALYVASATMGDKNYRCNGISLLFLLIPEIIAMFILAWFMMKEMIIEEKYK